MQWHIKKGIIEEIVSAYWYRFYMTAHCTLCGNHGVIDSTGVCTPAGVPVGRRNYCICPNGLAMRDQKGKQ